MMDRRKPKPSAKTQRPDLVATLNGLHDSGQALDPIEAEGYLT
jgi:hypothetical protein